MGVAAGVVDHATDLQLDARRQRFPNSRRLDAHCDLHATATGPKVAGALGARSALGVSRTLTHAFRIGAPGMVLALKHGEHGRRIPVRVERLDLALVIHLNDIDAFECD